MECIYNHLPVEKDLGGVARSPQSRKAEVGHKNSQTTNGGEKANAKVNIGKDISEFVTELKAR